MEIKSIEITNFRGFNDFIISDFSDNLVIVGKNDSGKTNLCYAIRKVLDPEVRRINFNDADSTNSNKDNIKISIVLKLNKISDDNRSILGSYVDKDNTISVSLVGEYDDDIGYYNESLILGSLDKSRKLPTNIINPLDKVLDIIYINPGYDLNRDKKTYFSYRNKLDRENQKGLTTSVDLKVKELNAAIADETVVKEITNELSINKEFNIIFENIKFKTLSNVNTSNIYNSLEIIPYDSENDILNNIGDGKNKTLSMLLQILSKKPEKEKIIIIEEPENHLYPQLQRQYSGLINSIGIGQFIITTHSSHIIDFNKMKKIIKMFRIDEELKSVTANASGELYSNFGHYYNEEISQALFYDTVLLVEGFTEKYFYNRLMIDDEKFLEFATKNNMGILCIGGIDFSPYKLFLEGLGIRVFIKTDNDIFKVPKSNPVEYRYAGIERVLNCLDEEGMNVLKTILEIETVDKKTFRFDGDVVNKIKEDELELICELFEMYGVYLSAHQDGFERELLEFLLLDVTEEDIKYLNKSKLKNLHEFLDDNDFKLTINDDNKDSVLVRFYNV